MYEADPETGQARLQPQPVLDAAGRAGGAGDAGAARGARLPVRHRLQRRRAVVGRGAEPQAGDHVQGLRDRRPRPGVRRRALRRDAVGVPLRRAAARRDRAGGRPDRHAAGRRGEHPRGHHVPDEPARRGPDDGRAVRADATSSCASSGCGWCRSSEPGARRLASVPRRPHHGAMVSRESIAAFRFGYGFRPGEAPPRPRRCSPACRARRRRAAGGRARSPSGGDPTRASPRLREGRRRDAASAAPCASAAGAPRRGPRARGCAAAVLSPHGFYERLVWFWADHFTVSARERARGRRSRRRSRPTRSGRTSPAASPRCCAPRSSIRRCSSYLDQVALDRAGLARSGMQRGRGAEREPRARGARAAHARGRRRLQPGTTCASSPSC